MALCNRLRLDAKERCNNLSLAANKVVSEHRQVASLTGALALSSTVLAQGSSEIFSRAGILKNITIAYFLFLKLDFGIE